VKIQTLQIFQSVAEELNITKAALKLGYSQPTVTKHINALEDELGTMLLERKGGRYVLTVAGKKLYKHTVNILKELRDIKDISPAHTANFVVNFHGHDYYGFRYLIPAAIISYKRFPELLIRISGSTNDDTILKLLKNEIEIGIVTGNIVSSDLVAVQIGSESTCLCISAENYREHYDISDYFKHYPLVVDQSEHYNYYNMFKQSFHSPMIIDSNSDELVERSVLNHNCVGIVRSGRLEPYINSGKIVVIKELSKENINVVINKSNQYNKYINYLFETIVFQSNNSTKESRINLM